MTHASNGLVIGLVSISDRASAGVYRDEGVPALKEWLAAAIEAPAWRGETRLIADEQPVIEATLKELVDARGCQLVLTTGGTGPAPRDVTPEATLDVVDRLVPGLAEAMRAAGRARTPMADLSRGVVGAVGATLVVNLPGSPKGALESLQAIEGVLPHALETLAGPFDHGARPAT